MALLLGVAASVLGGCLTITAVDAPSGAPSGAYTVTVGLDLFEPEEPGIEYGQRGMLAVRYPGEWELLSATYSGSVSGRLTASPAMSAFFADEFVAQYGQEGELTGPGLTPADKPGYSWWAGYTAVHPSHSAGPFQVTLVFDQHGATGFSSLDFVTGVTDPDEPENIDADYSWWFGGTALDRPVYTGVPVQALAPVITVTEAPALYAAVGGRVAAGGVVFDPDSVSVGMTVDYGNGEGEPLETESSPFSLGVSGWWWEHAWDEPGTYEITVRADDGGLEAEAVAVVNVGISPFGDVSPSDEFFPGIVWLYGFGVLSGYPDGTFRPYEPVLRAQFAKMAVTAFGYHDPELTNVDSPTFSDVPAANEPYPFDYVEEAAANWLVSGFADDTFRPWEPLSRIQLLRILVRSHEIWLEDPPADYRLPFGDIPDADRSYVALAHYNGLVDGKDAVHFDPYGIATRAQVAKILFNALEGRYDPSDPPPFETEGAAMRALASPAALQALGRAVGE